MFDCLGGPENTPVTFSPRLSEEVLSLETNESAVYSVLLLRGSLSE